MPEASFGTIFGQFFFFFYHVDRTVYNSFLGAIVIILGMPRRERSSSSSFTFLFLPHNGQVLFPPTHLNTNVYTICPIAIYLLFFFFFLCVVVFFFFFFSASMPLCLFIFCPFQMLCLSFIL